MATNGDQSANLIKEYRHFVFEGLSFASRRGHELSHEFMRLELQIAALLFAFSGLFLGFLASEHSLLMKSLLASTLLFLIASMVCGLFHIKRNELSWSIMAKDRLIKFNKWQDLIDSGGSFEETRGFHAGVSKGIGEITSVPLWAWILQSTFLGLAATILFAIALVFLFG